MRNLIAKIMVFCLLLITVHTASGGEHTPIHNLGVDVQVQSILVAYADDEKNPSGDEQIKSECSICHAAHILMVFASSGIELNLFSGALQHADVENILASRHEDIPHPPIILI